MREASLGCTLAADCWARMTKRAWKCPQTGVYINHSELALLKVISGGFKGKKILSYAQLQKMIGCSAATVRNSAVSLREKGFLTICKRFEDGVGQLANEYSLTDEGRELLRTLGELPDSEEEREYALGSEDEKSSN